MDAWEFITRNNRWHWRRTADDGTTTESATAFTALDVCAQDAQLHGCTHEKALHAKASAVSPERMRLPKIFIYPKATQRV